jgi:hypothetical protein
MATRVPGDLKDRPWGDVLKALGDELRTFIQQEMQLVRAELSSKVKQAGMGAGLFGAAGFVGFLAAGALTAALILGLALAVPAWAAALIVAAFYGLVGGILALSGKKKVASATPLAPEQALRSVQATKEQVQQAWERGSHGTGRSTGWTDTATPVTAEQPAADVPEEPPPTQSPPSSAGAVPFRSSPPRY